MPEETYSSSPHVYTELDIPTDVTGTVGDARKTHSSKRPERDPDAPKAPRQPRTRTRQRTRGAKKEPTGHVADGETATSHDSETPSADGESGHSGRRRRRRPRRTASAAAGPAE